jgi:hypothetical protein
LINFLKLQYGLSISIGVASVITFILPLLLFGLLFKDKKTEPTGWKLQIRNIILFIIGVVLVVYFIFIPLYGILFLGNTFSSISAFLGEVSGGLNFSISIPVLPLKLYPSITFLIISFLLGCLSLWATRLNGLQNSVTFKCILTPFIGIVSVAIGGLLWESTVHGTLPPSPFITIGIILILFEIMLKLTNAVCATLGFMAEEEK